MASMPALPQEEDDLRAWHEEAFCAAIGEYKVRAVGATARDVQTQLEKLLVDKFSHIRLENVTASTVLSERLSAELYQASIGPKLLLTEEFECGYSNDSAALRTDWQVQSFSALLAPPLTSHPLSLLDLTLNSFLT